MANRRPFFRRAVWTVGLATIVLCTLIAGAVRLYSLLRAASVIYGLSLTAPPLIVRAYTKFSRHIAAETDFSIPGKNGPVPLRVIYPRDHPNAPIVVLAHGLAPEGYRDGLLNVLAFRLAEIGLRVVIPNLSAEQHRLMRSSDTDDIGATIQWSTAISRQRVSLFGISFGGGLAIDTADRPEYAGLLKLVFSDAGYNSIDRLGHYYIGERVNRPDGRPYSESPPELGPLLMAFQYLGEMVPAQDVPVFTKVIFGHALSQSGGPAPPDALTPSQRLLYDDLRTVGSPAMREKYHRLLERHRIELAAISPYRHMNGLRAPLYILHGLDDNSIPPGEAEWTLSEVPPGAEVHVLITPWITHAILRGHVSLREKIRIGNFVCQVLNAAFRPAPL